MDIDEFEDLDDVAQAWGAEEEESLKALEAGWAPTQPQQQQPQSKHKQPTITTSNKRPMERLQEEDEEHNEARGSTAKRKAQLLPSSSPAPSFDAFEAGNPWSVPQNTEAERSAWLGQPLPSPAPLPSSPAAAPPAAKRRKADAQQQQQQQARQFRRVTSLPAVAAAPSTHLLNRNLPLAPAGGAARRKASPQATHKPGPDEVLISHAGPETTRRVTTGNSFDSEEDDEIWRGADEEALARVEEEAVAASQQVQQQQHRNAMATSSGRVFGRSVSGGAAQPASSVQRRGVESMPRPAITSNGAARNTTAAAVGIARSNGGMPNRGTAAVAPAAPATPTNELLELRRALREAQAAKQRAEGEVATVRRKAAGLEARVGEVERSKKEIEQAARLASERHRKEREDDRLAAESREIFSIHAAGRPWNAGSSVRRVRPTSIVRGTGQPAAAGPSDEAARKAGLTTPTRKGRGARSALNGGGSSGGRAEEERSPSQRRGKLELAQRNPTFAKFDNAFALNPAGPARATSSRPRDDSNGGASSSPFRAPDDASGLSTQQQDVYDALRWSDPRARFAEARAFYVRRRQELFGLLLSHTPSWAVRAASRASAKVERTIQRILTSTLSQHASRRVKLQLESSTSRLIALLASSDDAVQRFAFLAHQPQRQTESLTQERQRALEEFRAMCEACDEGLRGVTQAVAVVLKSLLQCFCLAKQHERIMDILSLTNVLCYASPDFVYELLASVPSDSSDANVATQFQGGLLQTQAATEGSGSAGIISPRAHALFWLLNHLAMIEPDEPSEAETSKGKAKQTEGMQQSWGFSSERREELLNLIVQVIEAVAWSLQQHSMKICVLLDSPGFLARLISLRRDPETLLRMFAVLGQLSYDESTRGHLLRCPLDSMQARQLGPRIAQSKTPLYDILALHLTDDRRMHEAPWEAHGVQMGVLHLLVQLAITSKDVASTMAESAALLAAVVRRLHEDTSVVWRRNGVPIDGVNTLLGHVIKRICSCIRLLAQLYTYPARPPNLLRRLASEECNTIYNGARHAYLLAVNRMAYSAEPAWVGEAYLEEMSSVTNLAIELGEVVSNPEEVEHVWQLCNSTETSKMERPNLAALHTAKSLAGQERATSDVASTTLARTTTTNNKNQRATTVSHAARQRQAGADAESAIVLDEDDEDAEEAMRGA